MAEIEPIVAITAAGADLESARHGAKAVGLQELMRRGLRVPQAFVIPIKSAALIAAGDGADQLDAAIVDLRLMGSDRLAVRSGAAISLPGAFETMLDVVPEVAQAAVTAVVESTRGLRVSTIAAALGHDSVPETAVVVQRQVDATRDDRSGAGAASSRHPVTGAIGATGSFVWQIRGDAVMAGTVPVRALDAMLERTPASFRQLRDDLARLDRELDTPVELEFTVESGKLWYLQLRRINIVSVSAETLPLGSEILAGGLAASTGIGHGMLHTDLDDALDAIESGHRVVLALMTSSPADVGAMTKAAAVITVIGGIESHASVVTRSARVPAVVAVRGLEIHDDHIEVGGQRIAAGSELWVDGTAGLVARLPSL